MAKASSSTDILRANLAALARTEPELAHQLRQTTPAPVAWSASKAGPLSAMIQHGERNLGLASRYDPLAEADRLIASTDFEKSACVVVLGMGLGYHVAAVARKLQGSTPAGTANDGRTPGSRGMMVLYEPDVSLLRAVLEKIDHTAWLGRPNVVILAGEDIDRARMIARLERHAGIITQGTHLILHPPTRQRHPQACAAFSQVVTQTLAYCRTNVATALTNSVRTVSNLACNVGDYAAGSTTDDLWRAAGGYPAVCVGAGPSLAKNVDLLRDPAVRPNVVLITAQTTLKPLLDRGIRPDFVTALDWSEISCRFYEDLPDDLPDVTLVAEPKAHPSILDSFPGPVRTTPSGFLDRLLGSLAAPRRPIPSGSTVAHLSFYLAQYLGCDPIIFIGQDLGFSDGLYYVPGTATHQVWSSELNPFNTIEMMEWRRIVRHKAHLQRFDDIDGQPIFTDEQMITYLKQFERDFANAPQTIIDATQGGMPKTDTVRMTLEDALNQHATRAVPPLPAASRSLDQAMLERVIDALDSRLDQVADLRQTTLRTIPLLEQMLDAQHDEVRMNELAGQMDFLRKHVENDLHEAFFLANSLNIIGVFKRSRADRVIAAQTDEDAKARQRRQIQRDLENLHWLVQACDETLSIFRAAHERVTHKLQPECELAAVAA